MILHSESGLGDGIAAIESISQGGWAFPFE
jgi:hypothetical protein